MSSERGHEILEALQFTQEFYKQIGSLLVSADRLMTDHGWPCLHPSGSKNVCVANLSKHIEYGRWWMPHFAFRYYMPEKIISSTMGCVCVVLTDPNDELFNFSEPLVLGEWFNFNSKRDIQEMWNSFRLTLAKQLCLFEREENQEILVPTNSLKTLDFNKKDLISAGAIWCPLASMNDEDTLKNNIIVPLVEKLNKFSIQT